MICLPWYVDGTRMWLGAIYIPYRQIFTPVHQGREFIANGALENGAFCTVFSENFHKF
jgi:hypothetical protein